MGVNVWWPDGPREVGHALLEGAGHAQQILDVAQGAFRLREPAYRLMHSGVLPQAQSAPFPATS